MADRAELAESVGAYLALKRHIAVLEAKAEIAFAEAQAIVQPTMADIGRVWDAGIGAVLCIKGPDGLPVMRIAENVEE